MIYQVNTKKLSLLQQICRQTFFETFAESNTAENMEKYLEQGFSVEKLLIELENPESEFYFATSGDEILGYLKVNFGNAQTEMKYEDGFEIERIYVLKSKHGCGVGQELFEHALKRAKEKHAAYIWLGVWDGNPRAINFYKKNGFVEFDKHIFKLGDDEQTDIMMKLVLV